MAVEIARSSRRPITFAVVILALAIGSHVLRVHLGVAPSVDAIRGWVDRLGWRAPVAFVGLVTFRQLVFVPSAVLLTAGGLIFGSGLGTLLGGTGIVLSGLANFTVARRFSAVLLPAWLRERVRRLSTRGHGPILGFAIVATGHPVGPLVAAQWLAGSSTIAVSRFVAVVLPASYVRAAALACFGATLTTWGSPGSLALTAAILITVLVPVCSPTVRRRLFGPPV